MKEKRKAALKKAGWNVGDTADFLKLSDQEAALIELKLVLARALKKRRQSSKLTQSELARLLRSSQSRIAKMEAGDPTVSFDLLIRSLLSLGASPKQIAKVIGS